METWKPDLNVMPLRGPRLRRHPRVVSKHNQNLKITGDGHNVVVDGVPLALVIGFSDIFLRPPQNPQEVDFSMSAQTLTAMALKLWKWQNFT